jgi:hypothetical protein
MPARLRAAAGEAGGFNAVQKLLTNPASRRGVKARGSQADHKADQSGHTGTQRGQRRHVTAYDDTRFDCGGGQYMQGGDV